MKYSQLIFSPTGGTQRAADIIMPEIKKRAQPGFVPKANKNCTVCGLCAEQRPAGAINHSDPSKTDTKKCISCMRCVAKCPHSARTVNGAIVAVASLAIKNVCSVRKECELFI